MALKVGLQLYSVRNALDRDAGGTLREVSGLGYHYIEAANHRADRDNGIGFGVTAKEMKEILDDTGLEIVGSHINPLRLELLDGILEYHAAIGNRQIGCDIEFFPYNDMDYLKARCEYMDRVGEKCREYGLRYYYHNHYMEFQRFGGVTVYDYIMEHTDPSLVFAEMDLYWIARGGQYPLDYIRRYRNLIILIHQKDFPADAPQPLCMYDGVVRPDFTITMPAFESTKFPGSFTEVGTGILPIQSYIDELQSCPELEYILLEQDFTSCASELESIRISMDAFRGYRGITLD